MIFEHAYVIVVIHMLRCVYFSVTMQAMFSRKDHGTLISRVFGTTYELSMKSRPLYHSWLGRNVFGVSGCLTARTTPANFYSRS